MKKKKWYDYLWLWSILYFILGFFNILFAWAGLIDFLLPLFLAILGGNKLFCNSFCGRGQLLTVLSTKLNLSANRPTPAWMYSKFFRHGFLIFFMTMFLPMLYNTYLVFGGVETLSQTITVLWTFSVPWEWAYTANVSPWTAQFSFGFYSIMLTSALIGIVTMLFYRPRTWCAFCPMGHMTQLICKAKQSDTP